jgi:DNA-binding MarR family transcriptional regulator
MASPVSRTRRRPDPASPVDFHALADLRYQIRRFLRLRELAARAAGIEPQQYLLLLQVKGLDRREPATLSALAERLQLRHHSVVQLVDRLARRGLVERRRTGADRRAVVVALRPEGQTVLERLALHSLVELRSEAPALVSSLTKLIARSSQNGASERRRPR